MKPKLTKSEAARLNGQKGGRPRKATTTPEPVHNRTAVAGYETRQPRTLKAQAGFLREFAVCGNILRACVAASVGRSTVYSEWMNSASFKELYDQAVEDAADVLEEEARRRAVDGVNKPVFQGGKRVGVICEYSDALLMFLLKGKRPRVFRERMDHTHNGKLTLEQVLEASQSRGDGAAA